MEHVNMQKQRYYEWFACVYVFGSSYDCMRVRLHLQMGAFNVCKQTTTMMNKSIEKNQIAERMPITAVHELLQFILLLP